jgi:hypothetical protein
MDTSLRSFTHPIKNIKKETMKIPLTSLFALLVAAGQAAADTIPGPAEVGARQIPLAEKAYAGSSINVVAGSRQTLYTDSVHQYAGFYDADGRLVLAKRRLGEDSWQLPGQSHS